MKTSTVKWTGERINKPGVYAGIPLDTYHSQAICDGPSVSSSNLRHALEENGGSPAHFYCSWSGNPDRADERDESHFVFGRALHHYLLGQPDFHREFVVKPAQLPDKHGILTEWQGNKDVCRTWLVQAAAGGAVWHPRRNVWIADKDQPPLTVISRDDIAAIQGIARNLERHPLVKRGLLNGHIERSFIWRDARTGLWVKCRPDAVPTDSGDYVDIKSAGAKFGERTSIAYGDLVRNVSNYAYHQQAALVAEGATLCGGLDRKDFSYTFVFVEKKPPYCSRIMALRDQWVALGAVQNRRALDIIATCIKRGEWPGPGGYDVEHIDLSDRYVEQAKRNSEEHEKEAA